MVMVSGRSAARGTCHVPPREPLHKFVVRATGQTAESTGVPLAAYIPPTVNLDPLGVPSPRGACCTCQMRKTFLARDPLSSGNGEVATPKLAHLCSLTSSTRCRIDPCPRVHRAGFMHVQTICTPSARGIFCHGCRPAKVARFEPVLGGDACTVSKCVEL